MTFQKISLDHPAVQALLLNYFKKWGINPATYAPPASWVGLESPEGKMLAVLGYTIAPDKRIAFVSDVLCVESRKGMRALLTLVSEFAEKAYAAGVETVCGQCLYGNDVMRKYLERVGLRPLSVVYAISRKEYEDGRRR